MTAELATPFPLPEDRQAWEVQRQVARATLWRLLGELPPFFTPQPTLLHSEQRNGYQLEKIAYDNGLGDMVYGYVLIPANIEPPAPAILYNHMHDHQYNVGKQELLQDSFKLGKVPAIELVRQGYIVFGVDAYGFGERQGKGPGGAAEMGKDEETSLFKKFLWEGRTLWGMIVRDDLLALNYLLTRLEVDPARVGVTGMSLGASRTTWVGALDERVKVIVPVAQMTRYHEYADQGNYKHHSIYYYLPGALRSGLDMEVIAALAAPRPQRILIGDSDPLSPVMGIHIIDEFVRRIYGLYNADRGFETVFFPEIHHQYTPDMLAGMLDWFRRYL